MGKRPRPPSLVSLFFIAILSLLSTLTSTLNTTPFAQHSSGARDMHRNVPTQRPRGIRDRISQRSSHIECLPRRDVQPPPKVDRSLRYRTRVQGVTASPCCGQRRVATTIFTRLRLHLCVAVIWRAQLPICTTELFDTIKRERR